MRALPTQVGSPWLHVLNNEEPGSRPTSHQCSRVQVAPKLILPSLSCCFGNAQKRVSLHSEMVLLRRPGLLMTDSFYCQPASQQQTSGEKKKDTAVPVFPVSHDASQLSFSFLLQKFSSFKCVVCYQYLFKYQTHFMSSILRQTYVVY